jgi:S1/P1 Nuclease
MLIAFSLHQFARTAATLVALLLLWAESSLAYGPVGHQIVGAIADERLADKPASREIKVLLDGMTLEKVSIIPDEIKGWDKNGVDDPKSFRYTSHPEIDKQLADFWRANQPTHDMNSPNPSHHWFHYTDVPVDHAEKYKDGKAGRSKWDVVQMIPYCIDVLQGRIPQENERKITKAVAIILLAHYVGDIHQPLHVGALYFNQEGKAVDPEREKGALGDEGGNTIDLHLINDPPQGRLPHTKKLHGFWDQDTVSALLPEVPATVKGNERYAFVDPAKKELAHKMATEEPKNWRLPSETALKNYAEGWADQILPIARQAHERLVFVNVKPLPQEDRVVAQGEADETRMPDGVSYKDWSVKVVREELHKAGWRLADLLEKSLAPTAASPTPAVTATQTAK